VYSSLADLKKVVPEATLVQLTDDEGLGEVNQDRVDEAIAAADGEIDAYLGGRYSVPLSSVPEVVKKLSADIAVYNLYSRVVDEIPETRAGRYKAAIKLLENIAKGVVSLGVDPAPSAPTDSSAETNTAADGHTFSRDKLEGF
jgi:phage gp36-like protein